jgi:hypothetical protein
MHCGPECVSRESNPDQLLGRQLCYRYTTHAGSCECWTFRLFYAWMGTFQCWWYTQHLQKFPKVTYFSILKKVSGMHRADIIVWTYVVVTISTRSLSNNVNVHTRAYMQVCSREHKYSAVKGAQRIQFSFPLTSPTFSKIDMRLLDEILYTTALVAATVSI